jgi:hypothetical protein
VDKYVVKVKPHEYCPLTNELYDVRNLVLDGKFNDAEAPTISCARLHEIMIGATSPIKKAPGCKCKNGKCGKHCGCRKKKVSCRSGCSCTGNAASEGRWEDLEIRLRMVCGRYLGFRFEDYDVIPLGLGPQD